MPEFLRPHHERVWQVLEALDAEFLQQARCYFGGGTRVVLELNEYRESVVIDLLCSDRAGYRALRSAVTQDSFGPLFRGEYQLAREIRADMYGIRTFLEVAGEPLKFEVIREGRIELDGGPATGFPVPVLSHAMSFAEKLLANADRGRDPTVLSRDLIDLAFIAAHWSSEAMTSGLRVAVEAYGDVVKRELDNSLGCFADKPYRRRCVDALAVGSSRVLNRGLKVLQGLVRS